MVRVFLKEKRQNPLPLLNKLKESKRRNMRLKAHAGKGSLLKQATKLYNQSERVPTLHIRVRLKPHARDEISFMRLP